MTGWRRTTWGEIADLKYGKALSGYKENTSGMARVYGTNGPVGFTDSSMSPGPDVVIGRKGAYRGVHLSSGPSWVIDTAFYLVPNSDVDVFWSYYALLHRDINGLGSGSAIPSTTKPDFAAMPALVPPLEEQRAIAEVLGALDDKIAANTKLAQTADELAHARFLNIAKDAGLGKTTYADVAEIGGGGTPKSKVEDYWNGDVLWLTPTDVTALPGPYASDTTRKITESGLASISSKLYPVGSICMTSRATIGAFAISEAPMAVNQGFIVAQPNDPDLRLWLLHEMRSRVREYRDHANGATFMELSRGLFKKMAVRLADQGIMRAFNHEATHLHGWASRALRENRTLAATRDALLPHLMSGKLRVKDAESIISNMT